MRFWVASRVSRVCDLVPGTFQNGSEAPSDLLKLELLVVALHRLDSRHPVSVRVSFGRLCVGRSPHVNCRTRIGALCGPPARAMPLLALQLRVDSQWPPVGHLSTS